MMGYSVKFSKTVVAAKDNGSILSASFVKKGNPVRFSWTVTAARYKGSNLLAMLVK